jgi:EAL domain-containing protein (putative c-di-GMP-specific phosphodiesterase class I)/putative methionine-R-sulfoxide reductase with GAF domain
MSPREPAVSSLGAERRRQSSVSDAELLQRSLAAHGEIVGAGLNLNKVVSVVTRRAQELTASAGAVVELVDGDELVYWAASGTVEPLLGLRVKADSSLSGLAARSGRVLRCDDSETDARVDRAACRKVGLRSMLVAPLPYGERVIGVLKVVLPWVRAYSANDVRTLELLNTLIGTAMAHAAQHEAATGGARAPVKGADALVRQVSRARIQRTIETQEFRMVFQPIVALEHGTVAGYESLARFHATPPRTPDAWFAEADGVGLGSALELAAIEAALQALPRLGPEQYLSLNASPTTLMCDELATLCARAPGERIVLEITEHRPVEDYGALAPALARLRASGVRLAIDDAGAGFASLRHILQLKPDFIKLDHSLTRGIDRAPDHASLVAALLTFSSGSGAALVAEGIETAEELATLERLGVAFGQGYHLGRPGDLP